MKPADAPADAPSWVRWPCRPGTWGCSVKKTRQTNVNVRNKDGFFSCWVVTFLGGLLPFVPFIVDFCPGGSWKDLLLCRFELF